MTELRTIQRWRSQDWARHSKSRLFGEARHGPTMGLLFGLAQVPWFRYTYKFRIATLTRYQPDSPIGTREGPNGETKAKNDRTTRDCTVAFPRLGEAIRIPTVWGMAVFAFTICWSKQTNTKKSDVLGRTAQTGKTAALPLTDKGHAQR